MSNPHLEELKKVQSVLMQMHRLLMASLKSELESRSGRVISSSEWMQLMIMDSQFAWMKAMLTLISDIDALMDNHIVSERELQIIRQESEKLFLSGEGPTADFFNQYKQIAQKDPDVILYHGQLRAKILSLPAGASHEADAVNIRRNWHVKPKALH